MVFLPDVKVNQYEKEEDEEKGIDKKIFENGCLHCAICISDCLNL